MGLETAAIAGIASLASTGVSAGMSFAQANKANRSRLQAERDARESMDEVMKRLEVNPYEAQPIFKEPFERQRENALALGAQAIDAASEGERGTAEAANRVLYGMNDIQGQITDKQTEYLNKINENILKREAELNDWGVGIGLKSAEGAQKAAANFDALANKATGEAYQGVASGIGQAINLIPLFPTQKGSGLSPLTSNPVGVQLSSSKINSPRINNIDPRIRQPFSPMELILNPFQMNYPTIQNINPKL